MSAALPLRICGSRTCDVTFQPTRETDEFHTRRCGNAERKRRQRDRERRVLGNFNPGPDAYRDEPYTPAEFAKREETARLEAEEAYRDWNPDLPDIQAHLKHPYAYDAPGRLNLTEARERLTASMAESRNGSAGHRDRVARAKAIAKAKQAPGFWQMAGGER